MSLIDHIAAAADLAALDALRVAALGKSGEITAALKSLGGMTPDERSVEGPKIHARREDVTAAIAARKGELEAAILDARLATEKLDLSLPAREAPRGSVHPVSQVMDELTEIFADMGFAVAEGPEIEDDWHNFTALNIPETHPARAMHDTFYLDSQSHWEKDPGGQMTEAIGAGEAKKFVLRTHTSPVQIRTMMAGKLPIRIIAPGRVYRSDSDATHTPMFHQIEGLVIDKGINMGHLKWTLLTFLKAFFEREDVAIRMFASYFPFTEPSADVQVGWKFEDGRRVIGGSENWMEVLGAGMVHPRVIANCGLDPDEWQGFAFGTGVDRLAMLKYGMSDLRAFFDGDLRWMKHYGFSALTVPTLSGGIGA